MKKRKTKKKVKGLIIKILIALIILSVIGVAVYYFLTAEDEDNSLTLIEKQWIENNRATLISINVPNNIDIIANEGSGVLFEFLNYVEDETELAFNKIPYNYPIKDEQTGLSFAILKNDNKILKNDLLVLEDNYVVLSKVDKYLNTLDEITGSAIGVLSSDKDIVGNYFINNNLSYKDYEDVDKLLSGLSKDEVKYIVMPRYSYLNDITGQESLYINYNINNLSNKYVLRFGDNERLNNILSKMLENWLNKEYRKTFDTYLMNFYSNKESLSEMSKANLTSKVFKYGYVKDDGYNFLHNDTLYGIAGEYLNSLTNMANVEFDFIEYENKEELEKALNNKKVDMAFLNFEYSNDQYYKTRSQFKEELVAISNKYYPITKTSGLINKKLYVKENNYLYDYVNNNISSNINKIKNYKDEIKTDSLIVLDKNEYLYLKNSSLVNYEYLFSDYFVGDYHYVVSINNEILYNTLSFLIDNTSYNYYETIGVNALQEASMAEHSFKEIYMIILAIILLPILIIFLSVVITKNSKNLKIIKKENILKYNDILTNLKNRNYLNDNIDKWDNTKIYPRTIVIIDLNNLKYVNDNYGHEEGNDLIKKAASILISTQLEKSEIIRTDGNEFLIYLIGYTDKQISSYVSSLSKEFEKLPYGFGAAIGYSSILDEIKTIDDAINEATIEMRMDKEKNYR